MAKLDLTMAAWDYDRFRALADGTIVPDGISLNCLNLPVEETFFRMVRYGEFDVAEMSLSSYVISMFRDNPPFVAIPVFPSRCFRHSNIFINKNSGIESPSDLRGKRVGLPEYQLTANVWIRGILSDEYDVPVTSTTFYMGGEEEPGRIEKQKLTLPPEIKLVPIGETQMLSQMLENGEIDAIYSPRTPSTLRTGKNVRRLFENYNEVEIEYYKRTKIFPIMHVLVIRREIYEKHPWVAQSLQKAMKLAQQKCYNDMRETAALKYMLPWLIYIEQLTREVMGPDFWPYGLGEVNQHVLETFLRYSYEQGMAKKLLKPEELFVPESLEEFKI